MSPLDQMDIQSLESIADASQTAPETSEAHAYYTYTERIDRILQDHPLQRDFRNAFLSGNYTKLMEIIETLEAERNAA